MPTLHLAYRAAPGHAAEPAELARNLTELTARVLLKRAEVTALHLQPLAAQQVWVGGVDPSQAPAGAQGHFRLQIDITAGSNTAAQKAAFIAAAHAALARWLGPVHPASYVVVHELPADSWGYGGQTQARRAAERDRLAAAA